MSAPREVPKSKPSPAGTPTPPAGSPKGDGFLVPSPIPTRRSRTYSQSERARAGPTLHGQIKSFCRERGHGFIVPLENYGEPIFVHISDVEGELVPREGDEVTYKLCGMPPKYEKFCAVHVVIVHPRDDVPHERWGEHHRGSATHPSPSHT
jgi:cold shock CspA family protein